MLSIEPVPFLRDNYAWIIHDGRDAVVVDPGEPEPILAWLATRRIRLRALLITHHHGDHAGGIMALAATGARVFGPRGNHIRGITHPVDDGQRIAFDHPDVSFEVMAVPGHTLDHLAYVGQGHVFCGDTLFSCGCGRVFEGTHAMMRQSLARIAALPDDTRVACAHEYTRSNLAFARRLEPQHPQLLAWEHEVTQLRAKNLPSLPVMLGDEKQRNPFLRWDDPQLRQVMLGSGMLSESEAEDREKVFATLRQLKDQA